MTITDRAVLKSLSLEWERLTHDPNAKATFESWCLSEPALASAGRLADLLKHRSRLEPGAANQLLSALLRVKEPLADRAFLQAMLPGVASVTRYAISKRWVNSDGPWLDPGEVDAESLARAWSWIDGHGADSTQWPAQTLVCHLRHGVQGTAARHFLQHSRAELFDLAVHDRVGDRDAERVGVDGAVQLLCDGHRSGRLPLLHAQVLYAIRVRRSGYAELSTATGRSVDGLKQSCRRAERGLAALVEVAE